ncbi:MAG: type II toxin-antitoxin system RelE/ParE family toxin [Polyangiaceae bacterium]|nr:type II toxin-antitoxin system RelE/ParE family toxin [Polyangiaceae bacterium]
MRVRATGRAKREIARAALWWSKNRPQAPLLFLEELDAAKRRLSTAPLSGQIYGYRKNRLIRRWLLEKTEYRVYFSVNRKAQVIMLHSIRGARRGRGPKL